MKYNKYSLEKAVKFIEKIESAKNYKSIHPLELVFSLRKLADVNDEKNFRRIIEGYKNIENKVPKSEKPREPILYFLEFLCADADLGYINNLREPKKTQKYFINLYGSHLSRYDVN